MSLAVSLPVQVFDISRSGVLLGSKAEPATGDRAELHATVGPRSLSVSCEVRHVSLDPTARGGVRHRAGAAFVTPTTEQRLVLEQLLGAKRT